MIDVEIEAEAWVSAVPEAQGVAAQAADAALRAADAEGDVAILLCDDDAIAELNASFRGKTAPTNVLSFPSAETARPHLGDIAVAFGVCAREAASQGKPLAHHLAHLVAHGVLHLVGYDHETEAEAETMEALERRLLGDLGVPDPYQIAPGAPDR